VSDAELDDLLERARQEAAEERELLGAASRDAPASRSICAGADPRDMRGAGTSQVPRGGASAPGARVPDPAGDPLRPQAAARPAVAAAGPRSTA
jgi:hypothetical protein